MKKGKGTFTLEYAMVICAIVAGLIGTSLVLKRAICGRWRESADSFGFTQQYDIVSGTYECWASHWYTVQPGYHWINCDIVSRPYCRPDYAICYEVSGRGFSNKSMSEACSIAVTNALSQKPSFRIASWIGWVGGKYYSDGTPNQYYCGTTPPS